MNFTGKRRANSPVPLFVSIFHHVKLPSERSLAPGVMRPYDKCAVEREPTPEHRPPGVPVT